MWREKEVARRLSFPYRRRKFLRPQSRFSMLLNRRKPTVGERFLGRQIRDEDQETIWELMRIWSRIYYIDSASRRSQVEHLLRLAVALAVMSESPALLYKVKPQLVDITIGYAKKRNIIPRSVRGFFFSIDQPKSNKVLVGLFCVIYFALPTCYIAYTLFGKTENIWESPQRNSSRQSFLGVLEAAACCVMIMLIHHMCMSRINFPWFFQADHWSGIRAHFSRSF